MKVLKYGISVVFCNALRFLRFFPNNDPIMGCMLPFSKQGKWWHAALFAFLTMASFDFITGKVGIWTIVTALTYAGLGAGFYFAFKKIDKVKMKHYLGGGIIGVLAFDFITGPIMSSWMFSMPFEMAFLGQIPFTIMHLASASFYIVLITPLLDRAVVSNPAMEDSKAFDSVKRFFAIRS